MIHSGGTDENTARVWMILGKKNTNFLCNLMRKAMKQEITPNEWRKNVLIPIHISKGDIKYCSNHTGIRLHCIQRSYGRG